MVCCSSMVTPTFTTLTRIRTAKPRRWTWRSPRAGGRDVLTNIEGRGPLVRDEDVVAFGYRDWEEQAASGSQPLPAALQAIDLRRIRSGGVDAAGRDAVRHLTRSGGPDLGFWVHVDADVLDDTIMPAVDYRLPGGLSLGRADHGVAHRHRVAADGRPRGDDLQPEARSGPDGGAWTGEGYRRRARMMDRRTPLTPRTAR